MSVEEAHVFFNNHSRIKRRLETLLKVGLGYIKLGQRANTLSGGESQRVKLSKELGKYHTGRTLYILDEPTTGLHFQDIKLLLKVLHNLTDQGNTVIVIEHNLDVVKTADWIVDIGPNGGAQGGEIIAEGTPEDIVKVKSSHTGKFFEKNVKMNIKIKNSGMTQQPNWPDLEQVNQITKMIKEYPNLVSVKEIINLKRQLANASKGDGFILQGGDCAETFTEFINDMIQNKLKVLLQMSAILQYVTKINITKIGRIAGHFLNLEVLNMKLGMELSCPHTEVMLLMI